jgi:hypothetical protein
MREFISGFDNHGTVCTRTHYPHACGESVDPKTGEYKCADCEHNKKVWMPSVRPLNQLGKGGSRHYKAKGGKR